MLSSNAVVHRALLVVSFCGGFSFAGHNQSVFGQQGVRTSDDLKPNENTVKATASETEQIRQIYEDYQKHVKTLLVQLRAVQGIKHSGELGFGRYPSDADIRLSGMEVTRRPDSDEFPLPEKMSPKEETLIHVAGEIRAVECGNLLLNRITEPGNIPNPVGGRMALPYRQGSPAFDALCKIGPTICPEAIKRIPLEKDLEKRVFIVGFLQTCLGDSSARAALQKLRGEIGNDPLQASRVDEALAQLDDGPCPASLHKYHKSRIRDPR